MSGSETVRSTNVPQNLIGGYFNSLGNLVTQDLPTYQVGVQITLAWGNRTANANLGRNLVQADRIKYQQAQIEQIIEAEVCNSLQALRSAEARLAAATRDSAEQIYESEQRLFRAGTTTFYLVQQRQTELLTSRGRELQAQTDLNKAISEFQRATGTTLTANNVTVSEGTNLIKSNSDVVRNFPFVQNAENKELWLFGVGLTPDELRCHKITGNSLSKSSYE